MIKELRLTFGTNAAYTDENVMLTATHTHSGPGGFMQYLLFDVTCNGFIRQSYEALVAGITKVINNMNA